MFINKLSHLIGGLALATALTFGLASCEKNNNTEDPTPDPIEVDVTLDTFHDGLYFGDFHKEGYADYYFVLSKGELGQVSEVDVVPMNPGGYVLRCDIWSSISADHANAIIPEGTYTSHAGRENGTFNTELTFATYNEEKVGDLYRIKQLLTQEGTITVKHIAEGYDIRAELTTTDGNKYIYSYKGAITMRDMSGEGDKYDNGHIKANLDIKTNHVTKQLFQSSDNYDNYVLRLFDSEKHTGDGLYPKGVGHKIQLDLYTAKGSDLTGTYKVGERLGYTPGTFYPGVWLGVQAMGTFCMQIDETYKARFCAIKDGEIKITKDSEGKYTIVCDFIDSDGFSVKTSWTGEMEDFKVVEEPQTTLTSDVTMNPTLCSEVNYYGDYYANGAANYGIGFTTETETLAIDFIAPAGNNADALPEGMFTVSTSKEPGTITPGSIGISDAEPSCYIRYEKNNGQLFAKDKAPIAGGTMQISRNADGTYTVTFNFTDDNDLVDKSIAPNKISGTWTGTLPVITDYTKVN